MAVKRQHLNGLQTAGLIRCAWQSITHDLIMIYSSYARKHHCNFSFSAELNGQLITSRPCFQSATRAAHVP